jgi:hypothetical protein
VSIEAISWAFDLARYMAEIAAAMDALGSGNN